MATSLSVAEAKRRFSDVLGSVRHRGERVVVERRGRPIAAIVPLDDLARLEGEGAPPDTRRRGAKPGEPATASRPEASRPVIVLDTDALSELMRPRPASRL